ncbi:MAG: BrnT family toxin [Deltaproteobacteria bacterium]|nr:BrnT family toxin [Deltaproteobacteria bacterium]
MKTVRSIRWTETSAAHISRHRVKPEEVEDVCYNENDPPLIRTGRDDLHYVFGQTQGGRFLFIVVRFIRPGEVRVITARDMNSWEKKYCKNRGK